MNFPASLLYKAPAFPTNLRLKTRGPLNVAYFAGENFGTIFAHSLQFVPSMSYWFTKM